MKNYKTEDEKRKTLVRSQKQRPETSSYQCSLVGCLRRSREASATPESEGEREVLPLELLSHLLLHLHLAGLNGDGWELVYEVKALAWIPNSLVLRFFKFVGKEGNYICLPVTTTDGCKVGFL